MFTPKKIFFAALALLIGVAGMGFRTLPAQAAGCTQYHIVRRGDNLHRIGLRYGVTWRYLADLNNFRNLRKIYPKHELYVSSSGNPYPISSNSSARSDLWSFRVIWVEKNSSVSIITANMPDNVLFESYIGRDKGNNTKWVQSNDFDSEKGGSIKATFLIPEEFKGDSPLVIKLVQQKKNKNVTFSQRFTNATSPSQRSNRTSSYTYNGGLPTIWVQSIVRNQSVTIRTFNFPADLKYDVYMGQRGETRTIHGNHVGTLNSGDSGTITANYGSKKSTFQIPEELIDISPVVIKLVQHKKNKDVTHSQWFTNATSSYQSSSGSPLYPYYGGIPAFWIQSVVRDKSVTIKTQNFPPYLKFDVYMGPKGTRAINGYQVGTLNSGDGGAMTATYTIPAALRGSYQIAIRTQNSPAEFFSDNWFYNKTTR